MYVRTKKGEIFECYESEQMHKPIYYPKKSKTNGYIDYEEVYKKSNNIISVLEVGDYVNGKKVTKINLDKTINGEAAILCGDSNYDCLDVIYKNRDIKSIVTHQQFSAMEYKVESEVK